MGDKGNKAKEKRSKQVVMRAQPKATVKSARHREDPEKTSDRCPVWVFSILDEDGPWGKDKLEDGAIWADVLPKIRSYETMTWGQIDADRKRNHFISYDNLCKPARDRFDELDLDVDELFRFRFTGEKRLWGIRERDVFKILWWDPHHEVCPSALKNT